MVSHKGTPLQTKNGRGTIMNDRNRAILGAIVEQYIATGEPVPSQSVARSPAFGLSSASIRNAMADLASQGYLEQPHISAGRVPTAKAFRLYVDTLLTPRSLQERHKSAIARALARDGAEVSQVLRRASSMVSAECSQLGVVLAPPKAESRWRSLEFAPVGNSLVLAVLILEGGVVKTRMVPVRQEYSHDELAKFSNYLNSFFRGRTLEEARIQIEAELHRQGEDLEAMCHRALTLSRAAIAAAGEEREIFVDGAGKVALQIEFSDTRRLRDLLSLMEEKSRLLDLLDRTMKSPDITVSFHHDGDESQPWAVVSAPYAATGNEDGPKGVVSAVGPLRMDYAAVLPVVAHIAGTVATILRQRYAA